VRRRERRREGDIGYSIMNRTSQRNNPNIAAAPSASMRRQGKEEKIETEKRRKGEKGERKERKAGSVIL
jgi:hypothetical protein